MSSDAIIKGLKQGNAIEMATIEEVKGGMTSVLDGMLRECYNRSDALSDLMEKVQLEDMSTTAANFTAEQRVHLTKVIKDAISSCERAMITNDRKEKRGVGQAKAAFQAEIKTRNIICNHLNDQIHICIERNKTMDATPEKSDIHVSLTKFRTEEDNLLRKLRQSYRDADTYEKEKNEFKEQIANLKLIARIARIDLKATSRDEASDRVSFQEPQVAHMSLAPSPAGRGCRGSFSFRGGVRGLGGVGRGRGLPCGQAKP
ncbi:hypothetical protein BKA58DRAFT_444115 [Alternaria rosae]|uniref:uncharacterized protein n=1 Tax=Alternaria rosae TaxID=1187941 RepID=UPI001E8D43EF|nr:uncharacterized protein BKA58DRAFT_444115 [Alternaria rosae]KAH6858934.1 hypothetical protein BKA58DRAFT_444115 [Alternaria rosae]